MVRFWQRGNYRGSFCGRRSGPVPDDSVTEPPQDTAEPISQVGGTSGKTYFRAENTNGEGTEKGMREQCKEG